ncbi:hypothetical protein LTR91_007049 [Friedmanniomyces endolithicus]|uniref:Thioredoxin domain-containing protein n=1 Tax=Friedmanniomyces endolithicus TaxID=329885 RepID=A0AAN6KR45_9PEZI|nr:hypothetical protein LTR94_021316 [Friedmanniomyces endolithicus]KAK0769553.1 hypothetical protein LTR59_016963 [Friedmanniomyces endolithicus]KAK0774652.1 hypothetical protein LTR75_016809 [Friedmanniomyces endolithicus]KAK0810056.1 hypothetical protein LTR38_004011 [Friedmanniomyces endolithicus]KAK0827258.1 hypothetical protein LTR03_016917 [Friedmanniomyces endolithicus]
MHADLASKDDFDKAINTDSGKYVFIMAYEGDVPEKADEYAKKFEGKVECYKFDCAKAPRAKDAHGITETPCALIYKDGKLVKKVPGMAPSEMKEVGQMLSA